MLMKRQFKQAHSLYDREILKSFILSRLYIMKWTTSISRSKWISLKIMEVEKIVKDQKVTNMVILQLLS